MHRYMWGSVVAIWAGVLVFVLAGNRVVSEKFQQRKTFLEIVADRPQPDLETLAERSPLGGKTPGMTDAFYDLLLLREKPDARAVPVLKRILADHAGSNYIHGYAAGQALFCIKTPAAHDALAQYLLSTDYSAFHGFEYAFHWAMKAGERDAFISSYLLQNLSAELSISLAVDSSGPSSYLFTIDVENRSKKIVRYIDRRFYLGSMLFFKTEGGSYLRGHMNGVEFKSLPAKMKELLPGERQRWRIEASRRWVWQRAWRYPGMPKGVETVLETHDWYYPIEHPGRFEVVAMFEECQTRNGGQNTLAGNDRWIGRALSNQVALTIDR